MNDRTDPTDPVHWAIQVEIISTQPVTIGNLLALHVDAGCGRCRACTQAGTGLPRTAWPCTMHKLATAAQKLALKRVGGEQLRGRPE